MCIYAYTYNKYNYFLDGRYASNISTIWRRWSIQAISLKITKHFSKTIIIFYIVVYEKETWILIKKD